MSDNLNSSRQSENRPTAKRRARCHAHDRTDTEAIYRGVFLPCCWTLYSDEFYRSGFRITIFANRTHGDSSEPRLERVLVAGEEVQHAGLAASVLLRNYTSLTDASKRQMVNRR